MKEPRVIRPPLVWFVTFELICNSSSSSMFSTHLSSWRRGVASQWRLKKEEADCDPLSLMKDRLGNNASESAETFF